MATAIIEWLLRGNNGITVLGVVFSLIGLCYSTADLLKRRVVLGKLLLAELPQCLITGIVGGLALGTGVTLTLLPLVLLLHGLVHTKEIPKDNIFAFMRSMLASVDLSFLLTIVRQLLIYSVILGLLMGCALGLTSSLLSLLFSHKVAKSTVTKNNTPNPRSRDILIGWMMMGTGFGVGLWIVFDNVIGLFLGLLIGWIAFRVGLHPKPAPLQEPSPFGELVRACRIVGFWLVFAGLIVGILWRMFLYYILPDPVTGVFLLCMLLLFFGSLSYGMQKLEQRKNKMRVVSNQTNPNESKLAIDRLKILVSIRTGVICGLVLYGFCYGIPVALLLRQPMGDVVAVTTWISFCLLGLGFGAACGVVFCYIYHFKTFVTLKITSLSEITLRLIGFGITAVGLIISILPSLNW